MRLLYSSSVPSSLWIDLCPPSSLPIAHGDPGSPGRDFTLLFFPFRLTLPIGWIGGRDSPSKIIAAMRGKSFIVSLNVPCLLGCRELDRGNNSYQVLNKALGVSTMTSYSA